MLRNLTPPMRSFSMGLYGWLGCITLETCEQGGGGPAGVERVREYEMQRQPQAPPRKQQGLHTSCSGSQLGQAASLPACAGSWA